MSTHPSIEDQLGRDALESRRIASRNFAKKKPASWKMGLALQIEIEAFIKHYGMEHCGLHTLLFQDPKRRKTVTPAQAQKLFKKIARWDLPALFRDYIAVLDFHRSGAVHFHLVVACHLKLNEGWRGDLDEQHRALRKRVRDEGRSMTPEELELSRDLCHRMTTNVMVKALLKKLRRGLKAAGFPAAFAFELKPVRNPPGLARYLAGRYRESHARRDLRPPHSRCVRYSKGYQRVMDKKLRFSPVGPSARLFRLKKAAVGAALGISDIGEMISLFGASWEYSFRDILHPVNSWDSQGFFDDQMLKLRRLAALHRRTPHPIVSSTQSNPATPAMPAGLAQPPEANWSQTSPDTILASANMPPPPPTPGSQAA